jgi:transcriptional regulator with XRE-family HTH domain
MKTATQSAIPAETAIVLSKDLGKLIKNARKAANIPIDQAALLCGVSKQFLSDLEHGKPSIQFEKTVSVALQLGIELIARPRGLSALKSGAGDES